VEELVMVTPEVVDLSRPAGLPGLKPKGSPRGGISTTARLVVAAEPALLDS
jgi:hypothetical protein